LKTAEIAKLRLIVSNVDSLVPQDESTLARIQEMTGQEASYQRVGDFIQFLLGELTKVYDEVKKHREEAVTNQASNERLLVLKCEIDLYKQQQEEWRTSIQNLSSQIERMAKRESEIEEKTEKFKDLEKEYAFLRGENRRLARREAELEGLCKYYESCIEEYKSTAKNKGEGAIPLPYQIQNTQALESHIHKLKRENIELMEVNMRLKQELAKSAEKEPEAAGIEEEKLQLQRTRSQVSSSWEFATLKRIITAVFGWEISAASELIELRPTAKPETGSIVLKDILTEHRFEVMETELAVALMSEIQRSSQDGGIDLPRLMAAYYNVLR
jgi:DNA repair exonuclease SbcCD ATPase subunit